MGGGWGVQSDNHVKPNQVSQVVVELWLGWGFDNIGEIFRYILSKCLSPIS